MAVIPGNNNYAHLSTNATTVLRTGPGTLHSCTINKVGTTGNIVTFYDNTAGSGNVIAVLDTTNYAGTFLYDIQFLNGLTAVVGTGVAGDLTVAFQ